MNEKIRLLVLDDEKTSRASVLSQIVGDCFALTLDDMWWYSGFTLRSWKGGEIASGVTFDQVLKIKPHILISDLVLGDEWDQMGALRGLKVLDDLYKLQRPDAQPCLPRCPITISSHFSRYESTCESTQERDELISRLQQAHRIHIRFFDWNQLSPGSPSFSLSYRKEFIDYLKKAAGDAIALYAEENIRE